MGSCLTFQHLPPEALSRDQPWTPERVGWVCIRCAPLIHRQGWVCPLAPVLGCQPLMFPSAFGSSSPPPLPTPPCLPWAHLGPSSELMCFSQAVLQLP